MVEIKKIEDNKGESADEINKSELIRFAYDWNIRTLGFMESLAATNGSEIISQHIEGLKLSGQLLKEYGGVINGRKTS